MTSRDYRIKALALNKAAGELDEPTEDGEARHKDLWPLRREAQRLMREAARRLSQAAVLLEA